MPEKTDMFENVFVCTSPDCPRNQVHELHAPHDDLPQQSIQRLMKIAEAQINMLFRFGLGVDLARTAAKL